MILVVALDGADWRLIDPLLAAGRMPNLASLLKREKSFRAVLESTFPPVTFPAWNTFLTGVNPGEHGVLDFTRRVQGTYDVRFVSGGDSRRVPTILDYLAAAGKKVASLGVPGTWPPPVLPGCFVLSGFDAPVAIGPGADFFHPKDIYLKAAQKHGEWVFADVDELAVGEGWHVGAREALIQGLVRKGRIAADILSENSWDLFIVHIGETDSAGHHFYAHHDSSSPRSPCSVSELLGDTLNEIYVLADRIIGDLVEIAGEHTSVLIASDHGMQGASDRVFHPNRLLHDEGFLCFQEERRNKRAFDYIESTSRRMALRFLPARLKEQLFRRFRSAAGVVESRRRVAGIDMANTMAFSEELSYAPSIRLNVRDREPMGVVYPEEVDSLVRSISDSLCSLRDPKDGAKVVERVVRREDVLRGPSLSEAPDLFFVPGQPSGFSYTVLPSNGRHGPVISRLEGEALLGGKGRGPTGIHTMDGVLVISGDTIEFEQGLEVGPGIESSRGVGRVHIGSCAPTILTLCGVEPPNLFEYPSLVGYMCNSAAPPGRIAKGQAYSVDEERIIAERLRALGYLD